MRLFVAINPPPEAQRSALQAAREVVRPGGGVRWTKPGNVHLTLKFLGEVPDESLGGISDALHEAVSELAPFDARLCGLDAFPSPRHARVIWAGVNEGHEEIRALAAGVEAALEPQGFPPGEHRCIPHATLGRARGSSSVLVLPEEDVLQTPVFRVSSTHLMKSSLTPKGAIYESVETFTLRGRGR